MAPDAGVTVLAISLMTFILGPLIFTAAVACILLLAPECYLWWPPKRKPSTSGETWHTPSKFGESLSGTNPLRSEGFTGASSSAIVAQRKPSMSDESWHTPPKFDESLSGMSPFRYVSSAGPSSSATVVKRRRILLKSRPVWDVNSLQVDVEQSASPAHSLGHAVEEAVGVVANSPAARVDTASADVVYFEEQAPGAWCGMHALNNFLRGPYVTREACLAAANVVLQDLEARGGGFREALSNPLDVNSGWLSADVINVLGAANFNLHVEGERPCSFAAFKSS